MASITNNNDDETDTIGFNQLEFIAQEEKVRIMPNFTSGPIFMLTGEYGPFAPLTPVDVPLWVACQLKKMKKCNIITPDWMKLENLQQSYEAEKKEKKILTRVPFHYIEIAFELLLVAPDDMPPIRTLLEDLITLRSSKIRQSIMNFDATSGIRLLNFSAVELQRIKSLFTNAFNEFYALRNAVNQSTLRA